jgi:hypothetical protein
MDWTRANQWPDVVHRNSRNHSNIARPFIEAWLLQLSVPSRVRMDFVISS